MEEFTVNTGAGPLLVGVDTDGGEVQFSPETHGAAPVIRIDTGVKEYSLNDCCTVRFNPTDSAFVEALHNAFSTLDARQEAWQREATEIKDNRAVFELARRRDREMREVINGVFGQDVCTSVFGGMNVYALAGGLPLWANLMLAVMDTIDGAFAKEKAASNPRIEKYLNKYRK